MITELNLKNFRCFKDFKLEGIRPINLIAGGNNVGKSSLLESIYLFYRSYLSETWIYLNDLRGFKQREHNRMLWESLFFNMDTKNKAVISIGDDEDELQTLTLQEDYSVAAKYFRHGSTDANILNLHYKDSLTEEMHFAMAEKSKLYIRGEKGSYIICAGSKFPMYISCKTDVSHSKIAEWFSQYGVSSNENDVVDILKSLIAALVTSLLWSGTA
ncbi:MAG: AAA family ATPase [Oscillospiraceae bacterium]|jgi:AAA15 family ATPase/GTPase|nr:AAA family ATPase [Oscillospiraceae bacterium]